MKIGIMQPYVFPYIGYFQLVNLVDVFVFYDDVNFIKKGFINRNYILNNNAKKAFTIPCKKISQNKKINEIETLFNSKDQQSFFSLLRHSYSKAPYYKTVFPLIKNFFLNVKDPLISQMAIKSIELVYSYLGMGTQFKISSKNHNGSVDLNGENRIINICNKEQASQYVNPVGGINLYDKSTFKEHGIELSFIKSNFIQYKQYDDNFQPWLSIIDVMMFNSVKDIKTMLTNYELI